MPVEGIRKLLIRISVGNVKGGRMTIAEIKDSIDAVKFKVQELYEIDSLDYTINLLGAPDGYCEVRIFATFKGKHKTNVFYLRLDTNEHMVQSAFELRVKLIRTKGVKKCLLKS